MANGKFIMSFRDYSNERTSVTFPTVQLTAANWAAQLAMRDAIILQMLTGETDGPIMLGQNILETLVVYYNELSLGKPTSKFAQREQKWKVYFHDNVTSQPYYREIPTADPQYCVQGTDFADLTDVTIAAFVTAFEAIVTAPITHNAVTVDQIELVGRNT